MIEEEKLRYTADMFAFPISCTVELKRGSDFVIKIVWYDINKKVVGELTEYGDVIQYDENGNIL